MRYRCKGKYEETLMSELKMGDVMKKLLYLEEHISCKDYSPDILVGFKDRFCSFAILIETGINSDR